MKILGIETSCDETAVAVVEDGQKVLSWAMASSVELHAKTGGIIPDQAAREQVKAMIPTVDESLNQLEENTGSREFDAIAVTHGPGLIGSLLIGVESAKTMAWLMNKPLIPVNHLVGHVYANYIDITQDPPFPYITLIVSGGHTDLVLAEDHGKWRWLGGTRDDAAGEAFDKVARILGLGFPGGPAIQKAAEQANEDSSKFSSIPRPMIHSGDFDFSFSGVKTYMDNFVKNQENLPDVRNALAAAFQDAVVDVLITKTKKAALQANAKAILLSGGVAANARLRERLQNEAQLPVYIPGVKYCTDNGAMIAAAAFYNYRPTPFAEVQANPGLFLD